MSLDESGRFHKGIATERGRSVYHHRQDGGRWLQRVQPRTHWRLWFGPSGSEAKLAVSDFSTVLAARRADKTRATSAYSYPHGSGYAADVDRAYISTRQEPYRLVRVDPDSLAEAAYTAVAGHRFADALVIRDGYVYVSYYIDAEAPNYHTYVAKFATSSSPPALIADYDLGVHGAANSLAIDSTHLYVSCLSGDVVKVQLSDMSVVASSTGYGGHTIAIDNTYVYTNTGHSPAQVHRLNKSDLGGHVASAEFAPYSTITDDWAIVGNYLVVGLETGPRGVARVSLPNLDAVEVWWDDGPPGYQSCACWGVFAAEDPGHVWATFKSTDGFTGHPGVIARIDVETGEAQYVWLAADEPDCNEIILCGSNNKVLVTTFDAGFKIIRLTNLFVTTALANSRSFWLPLRLYADYQKQDSSGVMSTLRAFSDGSNDLGIDAALVGNTATAYTQPTGVEDVSGDELNTTNYPTLAGAPVDVFGWTSGAPKTVAGSGQETGLGADIGDFMVIQATYGAGWAGGATEPLTIRYNYEFDSTATELVAPFGVPPALGPSGIPSAEMFGTAEINYITPVPIASGEGIGVVQISSVISPAAIDTVEAAGTPTLTFTITAGPIAPAETFGTAALALYLLPGGIASAETVPGAALSFQLRTLGIATAEALGAPGLGLTIGISSTASAEACGEPFVAAGPAEVLPPGIVSAEAIPGPVVEVLTPTLIPSGIASAEAFGVEKLSLWLTLAAIDTAEALGAMTVTPAAVAVLPPAIDSAEAIGTPVATFTIAVPSAWVGETFGATALALDVGVLTIPSGEGLGTPSLTILPGAQAVAPLAIDSAEIVNGPYVLQNQRIRPDGDISTGNWSTVPLWINLNEYPASDAEYVQTPNNKVADTFEVSLTDANDPQSSTGHIVRYRIGASASGQIDFTITLLQGATIIAIWTHMNVSAGFLSYEQTLSAVQADAIANYTDLRLRFARGTTSSNMRAQVSWAEMEVPAVSVGISPSGLPSAETFGAATLLPGAVGVTVAAIDTAEGVGVHRLALAALPLAIDSAEAVPAPVLSVSAAVITPTGIASAQAFGMPVLGLGALAVSSIASSEAFGAVGLTQNVGALGIAGVEAAGTPTLGFTITAGGLDSGEAFGNAYLYGGVSVIPTGIASGEVVGTAALTLGALAPAGIESGETIGSVRLLLTISPTGIISGEAISTPTVVLGAAVIGVSGILTAEAFGIASITGGLTIPIPVILLHGSWTPVISLAASYAPVWNGNAEYRPRVELAAEVIA